MPQISLTIPTSLAGSISTLLLEPTVVSTPLHHSVFIVQGIIGWSVPIVVTLLAVCLLIRQRRLRDKPCFVARIVGVAALGVGLAAIVFVYPENSGGDLIVAAGLVAVYGISLALVISFRTLRWAWIIGADTILVAGVFGIVGYLNRNTVWPYEFILVGLTAAAFALLVGLVIVVSRMARAVEVPTEQPIVASPKIPFEKVRNLAVSCIGLLLLIALAYSVGNVDNLGRPGRVVYSVISSEIVTLRYPLAAFAILLIALALVVPLFNRGFSSEAGFVAAALFGWAVVTQQPKLILAGIPFPAGEVIFAALTYYALIIRDGPLTEDRSSYASWVRTGMPYATAAENSILAIKISSILAVIPVGYFIYATATKLPGHLQQPGPTAVFVIAGVLTVLARWILTGLVFAALSQRLRGRVGPVRALLLSAAWFAAALTVHIINDWTQHSTSRAWTFPGLQLLLFLIAFSVAWDAYTLNPKLNNRFDRETLQETFKRLMDAYNIKQTRYIVLYSVPVVLAIIALVQQLINGTGVDSAQSLLNASAAIFGIPGA
jgi:hypothetical protein